MIKKSLLLMGIICLIGIVPQPAQARRYRYHDDYTGALVAGTFASALGILAATSDDGYYRYRYYRPHYRYYSCEELANDLAQEIRDLRRELFNLRQENRRLRNQSHTNRWSRR